MKIYALFQVFNAYDQPKNDLKGWWLHKPSIYFMKTHVGLSEEQAIKILLGEAVRVGEYTLRLDYIAQGLIK